MKPYINNQEDLFQMLDEYPNEMSWDEFYSERKFRSPFLLQNDKPDESLIEIADKTKPHNILELGCGEGRNAVYLAKRGFSVTAVDSSPVAIENAKKLANDISVEFICEDVLRYKSNKKYDLVYDSGLFHHLSPPRRLTYKDLVKQALNPGGNFGLTCFAAGEFGADEIDDWTFYRNRGAIGVAFTPERLQEFFKPEFRMVSIRKIKDGVPDTIQGLTCMWSALFQYLPK
jgi:cyclopropane fatty-acyl-phospholipid synthase-like methyltransferase